MSKDTFYFSHDSNARNDVRMLKLRRLGGLEAIGLFWCIIEILRETDGYKIDLNAIDDICFDLRCKPTLFEMLFECELLVKTEDHFYSNSLNKRMEKLDEIKQKRREAGSKGGRSKASAKQVLDKAEAKPSYDSKGKESKEEKIKEEKSKELMSDLDGLPDLDVNEKIAFAFWQLIKSNMEKYGITSSDLAKSRCKNWVDPVRLALQTDKRTVEDFQEVFKFLQTEVPNGDFAWSKNILSTSKLREKFEKVLLASKSSQGSKSSYTEQLKHDLLYG